MVNQPMLWYVEQSVPEPGCSATGGATCPMVQALMPEVLLPKNFAVVNADGEITGTHVALNYANSILNTGTVTAQNLTVNTKSLTNEQRSTNVGTIYQTGQDGVLLQTTGTVVQQGGFMSAANYQLNAQSIAQIGGALQQVNADGSVNQVATQQMLSDLKTKLGGDFTEQSVSDNLHTEAVYGDSWLDQLFMTAVMTGLSIMSGVAASGAIGALSSAASGTAFAAAVPATTTTAAIGAGTANLALSAGFAGMMNSTMGQLNAGGSFSVGKMLETGGVAALTAGLTNGITFGNGAPSWSWSASPNSLASLAGVQSVGNTLVPQAGAATGSLPTAIGALAAESVLQAGVQTGIEGGSFLTNLRNSAVSNAVAAAAFAIGNGTDPLTLENIAAHAALGCAASAAEGTGCGGGAIGGAVSAGLNPIINSSGVLPPAVLASIETLVGGSVAGALGFNVQGAVTAAQNETLNNFCEHNSCGKWVTAFLNNVSNALNAGANVPAMDSAAGSDVLAGIGNTALNAATFSLPGTQDFVPYFSYNNPALGAIGELYGTMGLGALAASAFESAFATNNPSSLTSAELADGGTIVDVNPADLRWTQTTAGGNGRADALRQSMAQNGYAGPPIDVVQTSDGIVTVDHTRAAVALEQGITSIPATVHLPSDPLPADMAGRFGSATTWGEAAAYRAANQRPPLVPTGTTTPPKLPNPKIGG